MNASQVSSKKTSEKSYWGKSTNKILSQYEKQVSTLFFYYRIRFNYHKKSILKTFSEYSLVLFHMLYHACVLSLLLLLFNSLLGTNPHLCVYCSIPKNFLSLDSSILWSSYIANNGSSPNSLWGRNFRRYYLSGLVSPLPPGHVQLCHFLGTQVSQSRDKRELQIAVDD